MIKNNKIKINKNNLILSAAIGYQWKDLKIFIKSLRKVSRDRVIFIIDENLDKKTMSKLNFYDIETHHYLKNNLTNKNTILLYTPF